MNVLVFYSVVVAFTWCMYKIILCCFHKSLFPQHVKERLLKDKADEIQANNLKRRHHQQQQKWGGGTFRQTNDLDRSLEDYLNDADGNDNEKDEILKSKPIAEVFEEATVMFADIVGFTGKSYYLIMLCPPP